MLNRQEGASGGGVDILIMSYIFTIGAWVSAILAIGMLYMYAEQLRENHKRGYGACNYDPKAWIFLAFFFGLVAKMLVT